MPVRASGRGRRRGGDELLSRNFVLLFCLALFSNCYLSVYYCFEQWLERVGVDPGWRGLLLGALYAMVMLARPGVSVAVLRRRMGPVMVASLLVIALVLLSYQLLPPQSALFEWALLGLRLVQGFFLAVYSSCTIALLVHCIPPGQSARGFALYSLANLLPYALLPTVGELLLPLLGDETRLYAATGLLVIPCLLIMRRLGPLLDQTLASSPGGSFMDFAGRMLRGVMESGVGWVYLTLLAFSTNTATSIFFMKGLCSLTGANPGHFFLFYCLTMIVVRVFANRGLDALPKMPIVPLAGLVMGSASLVLAWGPLWAYEPAAVVYGGALSLLYPLTAATIYERNKPELRPLSSNIMMFMFDASALLSPMLGGALISLGFGYRGVISLGAGMAMLSAVLYTVDRLRLKRAGR